MKKKKNSVNETHRSKGMAGKNPMNLAQNEAQRPAGALLQNPAGFRRRGQRRRLVLRRDVRQDRRLPPSHAAVAQLHPDGDILHPLQPRRRDRERRD